MSEKYDDYLKRHREAVRQAYQWIEENIPGLRDSKTARAVETHDASKNEPDEYEAYDAYFYGRKTRETVERFNEAWLTHIHRNPHHWQHWVLINDDPEEGSVVLEMPYPDILEMICDWWAFSWVKGDRKEIFQWYDARSQYIRLAPKTRMIVEDILGELRRKLEDDVLVHHGIKGQKWGVRNGPPYPLEKDSECGTIKEKKDSSSVIIPKSKFTDYALNYEKAPDKARVFESALGYGKNNCAKLIEDIEKRADIHKMVEKGDNGYGMRYEQVIKLKGPNGKEANVLTAWIEDDKGRRLTSAYVTKKEETK